jgi:succinate dehydrogenase / fumarate reductase iron-sulfur subunit
MATIDNEHLTTLKGAYDVQLMEVSLRVQRFDGDEGARRRYERYTVEVPTTATLLDCLDAVKDKHDGSLAYRKSCRMASAARAACAWTAARSWPARCRCARTSTPGTSSRWRRWATCPCQGPGRRHAALLAQGPGRQAVARRARRRRAATEWRVSAEQQGDISKETLCIMCGCCVSECNSMEADPDFLGPAALAKAYRFVGDVRDRDERDRLRDLNGATASGTAPRCYFCNQRCPKGVDPRDSIAKLGAETFREGLHDGVQMLTTTRARGTPRSSSSRRTRAATCARPSSCRRRSARSARSRRSPSRCS